MPVAAFAYAPIQPALHWVDKHLGAYRQWLPPGGGGQALACLWTVEGRAAGHYRIVPDGCTDLYFDAKAAEPHLWVQAPAPGLLLAPLVPGDLYMGVRLLPGAAQALLGVPLDALAQSPLRLSDVNPKLEATLRQAYGDAGLEGMGRSLMSMGARNEAILQMQALLANVNRSGYSHRQLRRLVGACTGLPPAAFAGVLRFQEALRRLLASGEAQPHDLYYDQPQLIKDFQRRLGLTPRQVARQALTLAPTAPLP